MPDKSFDSILKRNGEKVPFDSLKILEAIRRASEATQHNLIPAEQLVILTKQVIQTLPADSRPSVESIQDAVEKTLVEQGFYHVAKAYILYRAEHSKIRQSRDDLMRIYEELTFIDAEKADLKRENANIDADTAMGTMLKYGSEGSNYFVNNYILPKDIAGAHMNGDIHIHDKDFYMLTQTCCQIDLLKLFKNGFSTGHGYLREPNSITSYAALACIAIQANQNEMHGGQSVPNFDYSMAPGVRRTYEKEYKYALAQYHEIHPTPDEEAAVAYAETTAWKQTEKLTYQAMEALIHNLNTMNSRAGAQVPFSALNYGTDISREGRLVIRCLLQATAAGLGNGETPVFPVQIFKVKEGVNFNQEDPNYDLFQLAMTTSAKRLFPNFSFLDAPFNLQYYREDDYDSEVSYMGCRTRVIGNVRGRDRETTSGRGNLSFTSVNLPRLGLRCGQDLDKFFDLLSEKMSLIFRQLLHRFSIQSGKRSFNYPFLMGQGIWMGSDRLAPTDTLEDVLRDGTLSVGFIGLAETLIALTGQHHGESETAQQLGLRIVSFMRQKCDEQSKSSGLNFTLIATPAEGLSGRFVRIDKKVFGVIPGITDKDYYTNSFHVPVSFPITAFKKIALEAPYHALTNAGHISYVEFDGEISNNPSAFEAVIRFMKEMGIGYGSINHPVDYDPICGYTGIIHDVCPRCGRREGQEVSVDKLRELAKLYPDMPRKYA
ncbi:MAG: anaerobic ribonucleoside triphosphate reductase [Gracilibacteraceae bacterium]|jgi:ribonucleoside-triphosphate reductase|nr:anaerobic ribonucleoside triphosphate reductase [Gracilibacteraceae bacterium]